MYRKGKSDGRTDMAEYVVLGNWTSAAFLLDLCLYSSRVRNAVRAGEG